MQVEFVNVGRDKNQMDRMLQLTNGRTDIPVIVEGSKVTVGYGGT